ncbi:peptidase M20 domain-containing protein 2, partial [Nephila pilipes]
PVIAIILEYDALPGIGHACGHNLIAEAGLAAGLAIKEVMEADPKLEGKVRFTSDSNRQKWFSDKNCRYRQIRCFIICK